MADTKLTGLTPAAPADGTELLYVSQGGVSASAVLSDVSVLPAGKAGGQTVKGGTAASESLTLQSTAHATRGTINANDPVTIQPPAADTMSLVVRRKGATQTAKVIEIQTEANATLASIDKAGSISCVDLTASGNVTGGNITATPGASKIPVADGTGKLDSGWLTATGTVTGPVSSTNKAVATWNSTGGTALLDNSAVTIPSAGVLEVATVQSPAGTVEAIKTTAAAATASTTAGVGLTLTADAAVAGTTNAGAAAGGNVTITAGAAAQKTSGNANGGGITLTPGAGVGTGIAGTVQFGAGAGNALFASTGLLGFVALDNTHPALTYSSSTGANGAGLILSNGDSTTTMPLAVQGLDIKTFADMNMTHSAALFDTSRSEVTLGSGYLLGWSSAGSGGVLTATADTSFTRSAAGVINVNAGRTSNASGSLQLTSVTELSANGARWIQGQASELLTLSTLGTTTDTSANLLPANSLIEAVVARVTTTITTATDWALGDGTIATRFSNANSTLTAGTTQVGFNHVEGTGTSGKIQVSAAKLRVTTTGTPGAGAIRITVFYRQFVAPTS